MQNKYSTEDNETIAKITHELMLSLNEILIGKLTPTGEDPISQLQRKHKDPLLLSGLIIRSAAMVASMYSYATVTSGKTTQEQVVKRLTFEIAKALPDALEFGLQTSDVKNITEIELYKLVQKKPKK
jgi:hypothetical protein